MLYLRRPSPATLARLFEVSRRDPPTYPYVGATNDDQPPAGYRTDRDQVSLGEGEEIFDRAAAAVRAWQAQRGAGVEIHPPDATVADGATTLLLIRALGLWTVAPCRVVYVEDQRDRFVFAYGTLPGHPEQGEASFAVERAEDGEVRFCVASFSRPAGALARVAKPLIRSVQRRVTLNYLTAIQDISRERTPRTWPRSPTVSS